MWLLYVQLLGKKNSYGFVWAVMINPPELPIELVTKLKTTYILQAQVCDGISTKEETGNYWYIIKSAKSSTLK